MYIRTKMFIWKFEFQIRVSTRDTIYCYCFLSKKPLKKSDWLLNSLCDDFSREEKSVYIVYIILKFIHLRWIFISERINLFVRYICVSRDSFAREFALHSCCKFRLRFSYRAISHPANVPSYYGEWGSFTNRCARGSGTGRFIGFMTIMILA